MGLKNRVKEAGSTWKMLLSSPRQFYRASNRSTPYYLAGLSKFAPEVVNRKHLAYFTPRRPSGKPHKLSPKQWEFIEQYAREHSNKSIPLKVPAKGLNLKRVPAIVKGDKEYVLDSSTGQWIVLKTLPAKVRNQQLGNQRFRFSEKRLPPVYVPLSNAERNGLRNLISGSRRTPSPQPSAPIPAYRGNPSSRNAVLNMRLRQLQDLLNATRRNMMLPNTRARR